MSSITKREAAQLVANIRRAKISGHAIAARTNGGSEAATAAFLGGLESVLRHFLMQQGCMEAAMALAGAMNAAPTNAEIAARNREIDGYRAKATGSAS